MPTRHYSPPVEPVAHCSPAPFMAPCHVLQAPLAKAKLGDNPGTENHGTYASANLVMQELAGLPDASTGWR